MGCSATKTVPQERSTPVKGQSNGDILKHHKQDDVKSHTQGKENIKQSPAIHDSQNGGQTGGQMGGRSGEQTGESTGEEANHKVSKEISLSKDLGLRKLQRKETPQAGPLAQNNKAISQSQMEFFKLLDEKIEKGGELIEGDEDVT
ncbi:uncharacterized protein C1orf21 homolog [Patiria miniata]|uniref:Uncharacterized protein n=1 Tax=Patiria miniata TaxID=46514 RepID=A0A914AJ00_PATMI|nr:uncharacterized protein C1orf21 homolog [Patiria miniata]XP_038063623.1 uncharacterized protein C1orf21 homolog [Patiria miniata]